MDTPPPTDAGGGPTRTPTTAPTESPAAPATPTATPAPDPPEIEFVSLVSSWESYGNAATNQIDAAPQNSEIQIAWRELTWVHDGTYDTTSQVEIFNAQGSRVAVARDQYDEITSGNGPQQWEGRLGFHASWDPGEYTAEVIVRDNVTDKISEPGTGTFTITEPEPELEIVRSSRYTGEFDSGVRGVARNVSDSTLSYAEVSAVFLDDADRQIGDDFDNATNLAPGREWQFELQFLGDGDFASYELSTDWTVDQQRLMRRYLYSASPPRVTIPEWYRSVSPRSVPASFDASDSRTGWPAS